MRHPYDMKPGDLYWVHYALSSGVYGLQNSEAVVRYEGTRYNSYYWFGLAANRLLLIGEPKSPGNSGFIPSWWLIDEAKSLTVKDLPLYVWMPHKSLEFDRLLKEG
jgi:hypothetical protein